MIKNILEILSNPILYYVDKSGNSVFRNYCVLKKTGCKYRTQIPKPNVGKALEYKFDLDRYYKRICIFTAIILYLIFIHKALTIANILMMEFLLFSIIGIASALYSLTLNSLVGSTKSNK